MNQSTLPFARDLPPASHTHDPDTSRAAECAVTNSGKRGKHCQVVLTLVRNHQGRTASELADVAPFDLQEVRRRLTDLKECGEVVQGVARRVPGRRAETTWWAVGGGA